MTILAMDLGKNENVACIYQAGNKEHTYQTVRTSAQALHDLIAGLEPERVVFEIGPSVGWLYVISPSKPRRRGRGRKFA